MSDEPGEGYDDLDLDVVRRIDAACRRFEEEWRSGARPAIDDYLVEIPEDGRPTLRAELESLAQELSQDDSRPSAEPTATTPPSTAAQAATIAPPSPSKSRIPGLADSSDHEEATVAPGEQATVDQPTQPGAVAPDGRKLASAGDDGFVTIWQVDTAAAAATLTGHTGAIKWIQYGPDGKRLASASDDGTVILWDVVKGTKERVFRGHSGIVNRIVFSADGKQLVSAGQDQTVKIWKCDPAIWDTLTGQETLALKGHEGPVTDVAFSPDGRTIVSAGQDGALRIWNGTAGAAVMGQEL